MTVAADVTAAATAEPIEGDFWIGSSGDDLSLRAPLTRDETVDVAILGGGFSGLWTAYFLLRNAPTLKVALVERRFCGYGASGRNGGWCSPRFPVDASALIKRFGPAAARETIQAQAEMVEEIGRICEEEGIDAHFRATGLLSLARSALQMEGLRGTLRTYDALGLESGNSLLNAEEAFERVHVTELAGALASKAGANVHPGRLVRGLARAVERRGGVIYEGTEALSVRRGESSAILTAGGVLQARRAVVLAGEAYLTGLPDYRRTLLPMSSMIVLSEPLTEAQWKAVGWAGGESLSSQVHTKNYLTRTVDGRILYGSRGAPYVYGSRMPEDAVRDAVTFDWMRDTAREWWPALADLNFTHAWGGYLGVPRDWLPSVNYNAQSRVAELYGYTGRGVSTSALSAKLLAGLIGSWRTGLEALPMHRQRPPLWEPEPFRWLGVRYVQNALARIDEAEREGRTAPVDAALAEYLVDQ